MNQFDKNYTRTGYWEIRKLDYHIGKGYYKNGFKVGEWKSYFSDGSLEWVGVFKYGKRVGKWKHFNKNKELIKTFYFI